MITRFRTTAVVTAAAALLVGCSQPGRANNKSLASNPILPAFSAAQVLPENDAITLIVDGKRRPVYGGVTCTKKEITVDIVVGKRLPTGASATVSMTSGEPPRATYVGLTDINGSQLSYQSGVRGNAEVSKDKDRFAITGIASPAGALGSEAPRPFSLEFACR